jgi:hypothetical protein
MLISHVYATLYVTFIDALAVTATTAAAAAAAATLVVV